MKLVGTICEGKNNDGLSRIRVFNQELPVMHVRDNFVGKRVVVNGSIKWNDGLGAYVDARECVETDNPDCNKVVVSGVIVSILPEIKNARNKRSACIILKQRAARKVLVTALSSNVDKLDVGNLSIGSAICVGGYISYHNRGLHVVYSGTLQRREPEVVQQAEESERKI